MNCHYCGTDEEIRPYGPGGSGICFPCMQADPDRERAAIQSFHAQIEAAEAMSPVGIVIIDMDSGSGPQPYHPGDLSRPE